VSINTQLIAWIIGLPSTGEDLLPLFTYKYKEKLVAEKMEDNYDTHRGSCDLYIESINDDTIMFMM
jgi:hypothetical protein